MQTNNITFFLSLTIIIIGYVLKQLRLVPKNSAQVLSKIIFNVTLPALILRTLVGIELNGSYLLMPFFAIAVSLLTFAAAFPLFKKALKDDRGTAMMCTLGFNISLFSFPIIEGIAGVEGLRIMAMVDVGNALVIFGMSYFAAFYFSNHKKGEKITLWMVIKLLLTSIPFMSYILGLTLNLLDLSLPLFVDMTLERLAQANGGIVLLTLGITISFSFDKKHWKLIFKVIGSRYVVGITAGILSYLFLPVPLLFRQILFMAAILPVAMSVIPYAADFGYDINLVGTLTSITIVMSFIFMWTLTIIL